MSLAAAVFPPGGMRCPVPGCGTELFTRYRAMMYHWGRFHEEFVTLHRCLACGRTFNRKGDANQHMKKAHSNRIVQWRKQNHLYIAPGTVVRPLPPRETSTTPTNMNAVAREAAAQARRQAAAEWARSPLAGLSTREQRFNFSAETERLTITIANA